MLQRLRATTAAVMDILSIDDTILVGKWTVSVSVLV
jgi:hypothetical protein